MRTAYRRYVVPIIALFIFVVLTAIFVGSRRPPYIILAYNDLGMHCYQSDYSMFMILPPGNNLRVQVFQRGQEPELVTEGIRVRYVVTSQEAPWKYTNFWEYSAKYGYPVPPGTGITGNTLEGFMTLDESGRYWEATAIPVVGIPGGTGPTSPYQRATVTAYDEQTGRRLAQLAPVVLPVSAEMDCDNCHGPDPWADILEEHDEREGTALLPEAQAGNPRRCNTCHPDPILNAPGKPGVLPLSEAMHGFHADVMDSKVTPVCYNCHPGQLTQCNRGVMAAAGLSCEDCHGTMKTVARSIALGRTPWFDEPGCQQCHGALYAANPGYPYRNSYLLNGPSEEMNDKILCANCHNSPHAEWPSMLALDNAIPRRYQGEAAPIGQCRICHLNETGTVHHREQQ